jgi:hypothetical protein
MEYLDSLGYAVNSLCQIAQMVETNAEGISRFGVSIFRLFMRLKDWNVQIFVWLKNLLGKLLKKLSLLWYIILRKNPPQEETE